MRCPEECGSLMVVAVGLRRREAIRGEAAPVNYCQISMGEGMVGQTWRASAVDDKVDDSEWKDGRRFVSLLSVCPSRNRSWMIRMNRCSCVEVTCCRDHRKRYKYYDSKYTKKIQQVISSFFFSTIHSFWWAGRQRDLFEFPFT